MKEKNLDGSGMPLTEPSAPDFAVALVDDLILAVQRHEDSRRTTGEQYEADRLANARNFVIQALRVPKGEDLAVWDRYAMAALTGLLANPNVIGYSSQCGWAPVNCKLSDIAETAMRGLADACMAERSRREAQP
jgi:hypothetical protein